MGLLFSQRSKRFTEMVAYGIFLERFAVRATCTKHGFALDLMRQQIYFHMHITATSSISEQCKSKTAVLNIQYYVICA